MPFESVTAKWGVAVVFPGATMKERFNPATGAPAPLSARTTIGAARVVFGRRPTCLVSTNYLKTASDWWNYQLAADGNTLFDQLFFPQKSFVGFVGQSRTAFVAGLH